MLLLFCKVYANIPLSTNKTNKKGSHHTVKKANKFEKVAQEFEHAFEVISLATWNRVRTNDELRSFIERREAVVEYVEL